jgi:hypothetical protein
MALGSPFGKVKTQDRIQTSGAKSDSRAFRSAEYLYAPSPSDLGTAGELMPATTDTERYTPILGGKFDIEDIHKNSISNNKSDGFWKAFMRPYGETYYTDMFKASRDYYFKEKSPQEIMEASGTAINTEGLSDTKSLLPREVIKDFETGEDSPLRNLQDIKEQQGERLSDFSEDITAEEEAIQSAKDLYQEKEAIFGQEKEATVASGIKSEQAAEATIAQQGYEIGPAKKELELTKRAGDVQMGELSQKKKLAQEQRQETISTSMENIEGLYGDAEKAYDEIEDAERLYEASFAPESDFMQESQAIITKNFGKILDVQSATNKMFDDALDRAKSYGDMSGKKYKGTRPGVWKESKIAAGIGDSPYSVSSFKETLNEVEENIKNLSSILPQGVDIASSEVSPFMEGGSLSWLSEGYDASKYSFDD